MIPDASWDIRSDRARGDGNGVAGDFTVVVCTTCNETRWFSNGGRILRETDHEIYEVDETPPYR